MRWGAVAALLLVAGRADAEVALAAGGTAGFTLGSSPYFPTFMLGGKVTLDRSLIGALSAGVEARVQVYKHLEEEDFGSRGIEADLCAVVRFHVFAEDVAHVANPFATARFGGAGVVRVPDSGASSDLVVGYLAGASVGLDLHGGNPITRLEVSFDLPSFNAYRDGPGPIGELSLVVAGRVY